MCDKSSRFQLWGFYSSMLTPSDNHFQSVIELHGFHNQPDFFLLSSSSSSRGARREKKISRRRLDAGSVDPSTQSYLRVASSEIALEVIAHPRTCWMARGATAVWFKWQ